MTPLLPTPPHCCQFQAYKTSKVFFTICRVINTQERDVLRKTILELVKKGHVHYTDIEKKAVATRLRYATSNTVRRQFYHYLLENGYVERVSRGIYKITQKGKNS